MMTMLLIAALLLILVGLAKALVAASPLLSTLSLVVANWGYSIPGENGEQTV